MKKIHILFAVILLGVLLMACAEQKDDDIDSEVSSDETASEEEVFLNEMDSDNEVSSGKTDDEVTVSSDDVSGEVRTGNDAFYEILQNQFVSFGYDEESGEWWADEDTIVSENIINYEEAMEEMVIAQAKDRERVVVSFCNTFSQELQEAYQYEIEHYAEVDVHFEKYNTGLEWYTLDEFPYEIPADISYAVENAADYDGRYQMLDLDEDGEMEYAFRIDDRKRDTNNGGFVYKIVNGEPELCFKESLYELGMESLYYEGDYYLYMGINLIRCGAGCDLLSNRYEYDWAYEEYREGYYVPIFDSLSNTYLEYIVGVIKEEGYTWHEGYRLEGYEGIDFKSCLPEGLENDLPALWLYNTSEWDFNIPELNQYDWQYSLPVEVEGKNYQFVFLRHSWTENDHTIVAVLETGEGTNNTIVCMYSLLSIDKYSLMDERKYIEEMVDGYHLVYDCLYCHVPNESLDELMETYLSGLPNACLGFFRYQRKPLLLFTYEGGRAVAELDGEEFKIIFDENDVKIISNLGYYTWGILEYTLDEENGTEYYSYYEIHNDVYNTGIVLKDIFIRTDEDGDNVFTESDSYYCNGYELDQMTWERWLRGYLMTQER